MTAKKGPKSKQVRLGSEPSAHKHVPASCKDCDLIGASSFPAWRFELLMREQQFGWGSISTEAWDHIAEKLCEFETMTIAELAANGHPLKTYTNPHKIPNADARKRFKFEYSDRDEVHRFRLSGAARLYGFRKGNVFELLWWDPQHQIWPTEK